MGDFYWLLFTLLMAAWLAWVIAAALQIGRTHDE